MTDGPDRLDRAFLVAADVVGDLLDAPAVADRWGAPSALAQMSVGALACHLGRQVARAAELLPTPTDVLPLASADEHYARAAWVRSTSPDDPVNDRSTDDAEAELGVAALRERVPSALTAVRDLLAAGGAAGVVLIPWQGWSLRRDAFLLTRMVELVVHTDDLATCTGVPAPEFPVEAFEPVRDLLVRLAVRRHGQSAVVAALSRRERAGSIAAF